MRFMTKGISFAGAFALALALGAPSVAHAQERKSPLADAPAIRKRVELRDKRCEIGVVAGSTINQDFYHAVLLNARLGFHLTDWLAIGAWGGFNLTPTLKTSFHEKLNGALSNDKQVD